MTVAETGLGVRSPRMFSAPRMRHMAVTAVVWTILTVSALAQTPRDGSVVGRVLDQTGGALAGVSVELVAGERVLTSQTGLDGTFRFDQAPAGPVELTFRLINFTILRRQIVVDASGGSTTGDVMMRLSLTADVVVTAAT